MSLAFAVALTALARQDQAPKVSPATIKTFDACARMAGGVWNGHIGKMDVQMRFKLSADKQTMLGEGTVSNKGTVVLRTQSFIGIDFANDRVYYLDRHNDTVVYFGTVTLDKDEMVFDFTGFIGEKGHWISRQVMPTSDSYSSVMSTVSSAGVVSKPFAHIDLVRN